jgi:2-amino-4-hydroxy-6-hydroxymethyldihydropteridine diphosphokinase
VIPPHVLVIGLGGNLGSDAAIVERFRRARDAFAVWGRVSASPIYRTAPIGPPQPPYLNAALAITIDSPEPLPIELITGVLEIERGLGRTRIGEARGAPRTIDLDVLLWGARHATWPGPPQLVVPHPRLIERRFAIDPAIDVVGDVVVPGTTRRLSEWRARAIGDALRTALQM